MQHYEIVENATFVRHVPAEWRCIGEFITLPMEVEYDLAIFSAVLQYLDRDQTQQLYKIFEVVRPRHIYLGRSSFLREDYPHDEAYTTQESPFRDHGVQVDVGMADVEENIAHYTKRHFKWSEVTSVLEPLGYRQVLRWADDSGVENIEGLGLYSKNTLRSL